MPETVPGPLFWPPRIHCTLFALFPTVLAPDAFEPGEPARTVTVELALLLVPTVLLLLALPLSWRHELRRAGVLGGFGVVRLGATWGRFRDTVLTGIAAAALASTYGCHQGSPTEPTGMQIATLAVGQQVTIASGDALRFERVVSDSRCPTGVTCVWAGEVTVALTLRTPRGAELFTLSDQAPKRVVAGHSFALLSVDPHPVANSTIPARAYRVTLRTELAPD